jgi:hypothetical protein
MAILKLAAKTALGGAADQEFDIGAKSLSNDQGPRKSPWGKRRVISRRPFQEHFSEYRQTVK